MGEKEKEKEKDISGNKILEYIIGKTFARHSQLSEEDYLKEIGFDGSGKTENEAFYIATLNILTELTKQMLVMKQTIEDMKRLVDFSLNYEIKEDEV